MENINVLIIICVVFIVLYYFCSIDSFAVEKKHHHKKEHKHSRRHKRPQLKYIPEITPQSQAPGTSETVESAYYRLNNYEFDYINLNNMPSTSIDECEKACSEMPTCTNTTFKNNTCYLRGVEPQSEFNTGFKKLNRDYSRYNYTAIGTFGMPEYSAFTVPNIDTCEKICDNVPQCDAYSYELNKNYCFLKTFSESPVGETVITSIK